MKIGSVVSEELRWQGHLWVFSKFQGAKLPQKWGDQKFPADMHNTIWCPIYIPSFMISGSVVSEELRWQDFGTDGQTDGRSYPTPRPAFTFGDAGKKRVISLIRGSKFLKGNKRTPPPPIKKLINVIESKTGVMCQKNNQIILLISSHFQYFKTLL